MWQCVEKNPKKIPLKRGDGEITAWKVNAAPGKPLLLSQRRGGLSEEAIYFSSGDGKWREVGRVPVEFLTGDGAPEATVSRFSLFLPLPFTFHLLPFWSSLESCHCLSGRRGKRKRKRGAAHSQCHLCLPHSQTLFIPHSCGLQSST